MTLAILSYCGKKSHDAAAPAPAPEPKSEVPAGNAPTGDVPASKAPADATPTGTAPVSTPLSCQAADEINTHVINAEHKAEAFCFHKVEHPAASLKAGEAISADMQLKHDLDVAFLNVEKNFDGAQASCTSLGAGWQAPLSNKQNATPRAADNSNSLEAVGQYFAGTTRNWLWSSSTVSVNGSGAWFATLWDGYTYPSNFKHYSFDVVCVRP